MLEEFLAQATVNFVNENCHFVLQRHQAAGTLFQPPVEHHTLVPGPDHAACKHCVVTMDTHLDLDTGYPPPPVEQLPTSVSNNACAINLSLIEQAASENTENLLIF